MTVSPPTEPQEPFGAPTADQAPFGPLAMSAGLSRLVSVILLGIAVFTVTLAVPRFISGLATAPHSDNIVLLGTADPPSVDAQARALAGYNRALAWHAAPEIHGAIGALMWSAGARAASAGDDVAAREAFERSVFEHRAALAGSPLDSYAWTRLLQGDIALGIDGADVVRHARLAIASAPWEPSLITARLGLVFAVWNALDQDMRRSLEPQIFHAARLYPASLARKARLHRVQDQILRTLESDPDLLRRFSQAYSGG